MALTDAQYTTLKAHIIANTNQTVIDALALPDWMTLSIWYSALSSPAFIVWKTRVAALDVINSTVFSGAGGFIARTVGERDGYNLLLNSGWIEPWRTETRQKFSDIFSGSGVGAPETRAALLALSKRTATNVEKVFATGTGTDASPATVTYEGMLSMEDAMLAVQFTG